jgi:hypothetical protein
LSRQRSNPHLFSSMDTNVDMEKRKGDNPIPDNLKMVLNKSQRLALPGMELLGWELRFVRRDLFQEPVLIMHNSIENRMGILDAFGCIKKQGNIKVREHRGQDQAPAPAKPLVWI